MGRAKGKAAQAVGAAGGTHAPGRALVVPREELGLSPMGHGHPAGCGRWEAPGSALASRPRGGQRLLYLPSTLGEGGVGPGGLHPAATMHARAGCPPLASPGDTAPCSHFSTSSEQNPFVAPNRGPRGLFLLPPAAGAALGVVQGGKGGAQVGNGGAPREPQHGAGWLRRGLRVPWHVGTAALG